MDIKRITLGIIFGLNSIFLAMLLWSRFLDTSISDNPILIFAINSLLIPTLFFFVIFGLLLLDANKVTNKFSSVDYFNILSWVVFIISGYAILANLIIIFAPLEFSDILPMGGYFMIFGPTWIVVFLVSGIVLLSKLRKTEKVTKLD